MALSAAKLRDSWAWAQAKRNVGEVAAFFLVWHLAHTGAATAGEHFYCIHSTDYVNRVEIYAMYLANVKQFVATNGWLVGELANKRREEKASQLTGEEDFSEWVSEKNTR